MGRHHHALAELRSASRRRSRASSPRNKPSAARRAASRESAARLADPATRVIITGQQAGLFGGPLFTLLKAITTMKLAAQVSRDHRVPVVPVFWIDAEDHDWPEVSGCTVLDGELAPSTVQLADLPGAGSQPIARLTLTDAIQPALDQLDTALPDTEFKAEIMTALRAAYVPGRSMAAAFGVWLEHVLGPHGLVVYDSSDPAAKPLARDVFVKEISQPGHTARIAAKAGEALVAKGYHAQATLADGTVSLFHLNAERAPIRIDGNTATVGDRSMTLAAARRRGAHDIRSISARTCCCARWCRTPSSRRSVTWPDPTSSPISAS